jgi:hypothetical protein
VALCVAVLPSLITAKVNVYVPGVVAMPMRPALALAGNQTGGSVRSEMPGGGVPATTLQVYDPLPPVAVRGISTSPMLYFSRLGPCENVGGGGVTVTVVEPISEGSLVEVAVIVTCPVVPGARKMPEVDMLPAVTDQFTELFVLAVPWTVAAH